MLNLVPCRLTSDLTCVLAILRKKTAGIAGAMVGEEATIQMAGTDFVWEERPSGLAIRVPETHLIRLLSMQAIRVLD